MDHDLQPNGVPATPNDAKAVMDLAMKLTIVIIVTALGCITFSGSPMRGPLAPPEPAISASNGASDTQP